MTMDDPMTMSGYFHGTPTVGTVVESSRAGAPFRFRIVAVLGPSRTERPIGVKRCWTFLAREVVSTP